MGCTKLERLTNPWLLDNYQIIRRNFYRTQTILWWRFRGQNCWQKMHDSSISTYFWTI